MSELEATDFTSYFQAVHNYPPFPWQQRLTTQVLDKGKWPDVIDLPTGTGKTAVLDTAIFALAARPEVFPRRVVFVIDRRIVVDQVVSRAQQIEKQIRKGSTPILQNIKSCLEEISGGSPMGVVALRGGIPINREWAHRPDEPWVMVSTVDQFGSQLLFRGYGVTQKMRPIHAGLAGNDCLVILDEVHLSRAFAETLQQVSTFGSNGRLPRRFHVVEMSATPTNSSGNRFCLTETDLESSPELRRRVKAKKTAKLYDAGTKPPDIAIPIAVKKILKSELDKSGHSVGVIVNRVRTAREVHRTLSEAGYSAHLITGRMRPLDKARSLEAISELVDPDKPRKVEDLTVIVATQAIEVGADFSFDILITEVAPIDSLRQRFGRLDRRGVLTEQIGKPARAWIIGVKSALNPQKPDPVYGDSVRITWEALQALEGFEDIDFSPLPENHYHLSEDCYAPTAQAPLLLKTYIDAWIQTSPEPVIQPAVDWFLHGIENKKRTADVTLVWRKDHSLEVLKEIPLRSAECLEVPIDAAKSWLGGSLKEVPVADVNGDYMDADNLDTNRGNDWYRWRGYDEEPEVISVQDIRPGDTIIVEPRKGGLSGGTWDPSSSDVVEDLGDEAQAAYGQRFTLRLDPQLKPDGWPSPPHPEEETTALESLYDRISEWLNKVSTLPDLLDWQRYTIKELQSGYECKSMDTFYILASKKFDPSILESSDQSVSFTGSGVTLKEHLHGVSEQVTEYAYRLGLSAEIQADLKLAAELHDFGKVDSRFQKQMVGDDQVQQAMFDEPLAKSLPKARVSPGKWPPVRHEIMSVAMAQSNPQILVEAHDPDLVLYLVGTHHGYARPLAPIRKDSYPEMLQFNHKGVHVEANTDVANSPLALDMADRFWTLIERYGYYGLTWLETILRLADHQQSAKEAE